MTIRPCEWDVLHPLDGRPPAVIRLLVMGPNREPYYRAVSPEPDRSQRRLIGYWGSLEHAHDGVLALYEHLSQRSLAGGDMPPSRPLVPQKPAPGAPEQRRAARPAKHSTRA
ncbi:hypothetical protein GCM10009640_09930 [Agrococcus citreus]|uniref:Uncharacterized protein n=1 Tax=Agrococcus citreus TaxID=84643 RepID=A0ABN1YR01_9MICO